ncbi:MAG: condensation domain-containing protein, partial [Acidobacteriota bacterium]
ASFLELGGHSLLAMRLLAKIRDRMGADVSLQALFEAPSVAQLAERLLTTDDTSTTPTLTRRVFDGDDRPPTSGQSRLWFIDHLDGASPLYTIPAAFRLRGPLDRAALEQAVREVIRRHDALRSRFEDRDGAPRVVIGPVPEIDLSPAIDLSAVAPDEREARLAAWLDDDARAPFDLATGPLIRPRLARLAEDDHAFSLAIHHIVSDGWSQDLLMRELTQLYDTYRDDLDGDSPLAEPFQLADVAAWQEQSSRGSTLTSRLDFWRQELDGLAPTELPSDHPRPAEGSRDGALHLATFPPTTRRAVHDLARRLGATPFQVLLAAFDLVVQRHTGLDEVTVGSLSAGRDRTELLDVVGFLVETDVLRVDLSGEPSFAELVRRVGEASTRAQAHPVPFERLVESLAPERDPSRHPLFQIAFQVVDLDLRPTFSGIEAETLTVHTGTSKFDLLITIFDLPDGLRVEAEYATALFEPDTIDRWVAAYHGLIDAAVATPETSIEAFELVRGAERRRLLVDWNRTRDAFPRDALLIDAVREQVARTPDAQA